MQHNQTDHDILERVTNGFLPSEELGTALFVVHNDPTNMEDFKIVHVKDLTYEETKNRAQCFAIYAWWPNSLHPYEEIMESIKLNSACPSGKCQDFTDCRVVTGDFCVCTFGGFCAKVYP